MTKKLIASLGLSLVVVLGTACGDDDTTTPPRDAGSGGDATLDSGGGACPTGTSLCGGMCVAVSSDRANCGTCGNACAAGEVCVDGACSVVCPTGQTECTGVCADTMADRRHCGSCGNACATG